MSAESWLTAKPTYDIAIRAKNGVGQTWNLRTTADAAGILELNEPFYACYGIALHMLSRAGISVDQAKEILDPIYRTQLTADSVVDLAAALHIVGEIVDDEEQEKARLVCYGLAFEPFIGSVMGRNPLPSGLRQGQMVTVRANSEGKFELCENNA